MFSLPSTDVCKLTFKAYSILKKNKQIVGDECCLSDCENEKNFQHVETSVQLSQSYLMISAAHV